MIRVYLAGPMSGLPDYNYPAFNAAAEALRARNWHVENPAENPQPPCGSWNGWMRMAIRQMLTCERVVLLPGWELSRGAKLEKQIANEVGMTVLTLEELL
ncbi:MAG: hypothetical protein CTY34_02015 [Methylobacter sp.]|nr:MAG: hypothetical protein CTY34_02015 [Methylobacter sp.]